MDTIRKRFSGVSADKLDKAITAAEKRVKPAKIEKAEFTDGGEYNAVALPVVPHGVTRFSDAGKGQLISAIIGQQVVAARRLVPPVIVEYIAPGEYEKWLAAMIAAIQMEVDK